MKFAILALAVGASAQPHILSGIGRMIGALSEPAAETPSTTVPAPVAPIVSPVPEVNVTLPTLWDNICSAQLAQCDLSCNDTLPYINTCDAETGVWSCACPGNNKPVIAEWAFPAAYQECSDRRSRCEKDCGIGGSGEQDAIAWHNCVNHCTDAFQCGTPAAPTSLEREGADNEEDFEETKAKKKNLQSSRRQVAALDAKSSAQTLSAAASLAAILLAINI